MTLPSDREGLGQSESQLRALLDALPEPVVVHERGRIVTANAAFAVLLAIESVDDLVGRFALELVHPDDLELVKTRLDSTLKNRRTPEHRLVDRRGRAIPVEVTGVPFPYGDRVLALAIVHDLRERKRIEAELAAAERLASLGRIASAVGHEINNPLTYLIGALELLRADLAALGARGEEVVSRVDIARDGAERIRDIVGDLKALSSPSEGIVAAVDLHRVLETAIATTTHEIAHRAQLVREYGQLQTVSGVERRLVQVFVNLLINAAQSIRDGDVASHEIRVATRMLDATHAMVEVTDSGRGLPADSARLTPRPAGRSRRRHGRRAARPFASAFRRRRSRSRGRAPSPHHPAPVARACCSPTTSR